ncbi:MAG: DUF881 domain-containing protein [Dermatophilaceae bacterium]
MPGMPRAWFGARPTRWRLVVPVVAAGAGLMFSMSFQAARGTDLRSDRGLPGVIQATNRNVADRSALVQSLQADVDRLTAAAAPYDARVSGLRAAADQLGIAAGTQAVHGPIVTVSLDDAQRSASSLPQGVTLDDIVVHQQDVQAVVNALWRGGAEAMMVQDQRMISTSAVRCVGNTLILQGRVYSPPFVVRAMGNQSVLQAALRADPQVAIYRQWVDAVGLGYEVTTGEAEFPAYSGALDMQYATVSQ